MRQRHLLPVAVLALLAACATAKVDAQFDPKTDFKTYRTYAWNPTPAGPEQAEAIRFPEAAALVRQAVDRQLVARGLQPAAPEAADLLVAAHGQGKDRFEMTSYGYKTSMGPYGYSGPLTGTPTATAVQGKVYTEGTLILDLVDAKTKELVWRGTASDTVTDPERLKVVVDGAVKKLLAEYPPRGK
jgi:hypothetical protein